MIEINKLGFGYTKRSELFSDLDLSLKAGGVCGLLGKNGSGKTTLLRIIAGLLFADRGECRVFERSSQLRLPEVLQQVFFISEELYVPKLTIADYVKLYSVFYPRFDHGLLDNCMSELDLPGYKLLSDLSHGQKKKFLLAFGLATRCRLLILDEPTNGLDIPAKSQFRKLIASSITDEQLIIISTHQVHDIESLVDKIVVLDNANVILNTSLEDIGKKLTFEQQTTKPTTNECLYYEKSFAGYMVVKQNNGSEETAIDLELLFNTVLNNRDAIQRLF